MKSKRFHIPPSQNISLKTSYFRSLRTKLIFVRYVDSFNVFGYNILILQTVFVAAFSNRSLEIMDNLTQLLQDTGLSSNEAKVYLAALSLGASSVLSIAKRSGVNRTTAYSVIETLQHKGLMSVETRGFKQLHLAENPERLELLLEARKRSLRQSLPELSALYNLKGRESIISYRQGLEGLKAVYEELLSNVRAGEYYYVIGHTDLLLKLDKEYFEKFFQRRARVYADIRGFLRDSKLVRNYMKQEQQYNFKLKALPKAMSLTSVLVYNTKGGGHSSARPSA